MRLAGTNEEVGAGFVVAGIEVAGLLPLLPDRASLGQLFERTGEPTPRWFRYTLNLVVRAHAVPAGMARDVFSLRDPLRAPTEANLLRVETHPVEESEDGPTRLITVEALLPRRGVEEIVGYIGAMRERLLAALGDLIPFLGDHVLYIDSPHDGRDVQDVARGRLIPPEQPWSRGPRTMQASHGYPVRGALGIGGGRSRTGMRGLSLCNGEGGRGRGEGGAFLTAWSGARLVTKSDRRKEWMRRGLWTKVET